MIFTIEDRLEGLLDTVPDYYHTSRLYTNILLAYLSEFQPIEEGIQDLKKQFSIQTATWGLAYWEYDYGITPDPGDTYEIRRARLLAKEAGLGDFTKAEARRLANEYSFPKDAEFNSILNEYAFKTRHNVDHLIDYLGMIAAFEEMKPAHLEHVIGLLVRLSMGPGMRTRVKMKIGASVIYDREPASGMKIKVRASYVVPGKYSADPVDGLFLDGSFNLNGYAVLDGVAPGGKLHYVNQSESLTIRTYKDGALIEAETV